MVSTVPASLRTISLAATTADRLDGPTGCMARANLEKSAPVNSTERNGFALKCGSILHAITRDYVAPRAHGHPFPHRDKLLQRSSPRLKSLGLDHADHLTKCATRVLYTAEQIIAANDMEVLAVEHTLRTKRTPLAGLPDDVPPELCVQLYGRADLIGRIQERLILLDWKSGSRITEETILAQLPSTYVFTILAERGVLRNERRELTVEAVEIWHVNMNTGDLAVACLNDQERAAALTMVRGIVVNLDRKIHPAHTNLFCTTCPAYDRCPAVEEQLDEEAL